MNNEYDRQIPVLRIYTRNCEFVLPFIAEEMSDYRIEPTDCIDKADVSVIDPCSISSTGELVIDDIECYDSNKESLILCCPNIVGTGMTGLPMYLAKSIVRGTYFHFNDNLTRISTVHAIDVARAVKTTIGEKGIFVVTDCMMPTFYEFSEALAYRLNQKRILTLSSKWTRWIMGGKMKKILSKDIAFDGSGFAKLFGFKPVIVTEYLKGDNF